MAQTDLLKRYLDAGLAFTQMTQQKAEAIVRDLVKTGEVQAEQAARRRDELVERSRQNTERLVETIRREVRDQVRSLGLATQQDVEALRKEIAKVQQAGTGGAKTAGKKTSAPKGAAEKGAAKKAPAKKAGAAKKAPAKKSSGSTRKAGG